MAYAMIENNSYIAVEAISITFTACLCSGNYFYILTVKAKYSSSSYKPLKPHIFVLPFLQIFGVFRKFWLSQWLATLTAVGTTILVSPVAGMCDVFFRLTSSILNSLGVTGPRKHLPKGA